MNGVHAAIKKPVNEFSGGSCTHQIFLFTDGMHSAVPDFFVFIRIPFFRKDNVV